MFKKIEFVCFYFVAKLFSHNAAYTNHKKWWLGSEVEGAYVPFQVARLLGFKPFGESAGRYVHRSGWVYPDWRKSFKDFRNIVILRKHDKRFSMDHPINIERLK